jgi:ABC-type multidrug transport system ATPase subunit
MIQLHQLTKRYGPPRVRARPAVRDITLSVARGESWAVVGPNGAGKTTLFGLVLGFLKPTGGSVEIAGDAPRDYLRRNGAGYLPERFTVPGEWPVRETLRGFAGVERLGADAARMADAALERFGLQEHADRRFADLSHGVRQRVGLAQAFLAARELIVLDEPTEALDPLWRIRLRDTVTDARQRGATLLLASHDLAEVERLADRAVVIDRGAVREVMDVRTPADAARAFLLELDSPSARIAEIFPGASDAGTATYHVSVTGVADLSARIAALLATGALLREVRPLEEPLEQRVRRALDTGAE